MKNIHDACVEYGKDNTQSTHKIDYKKGANLAGFSKVANALVNYGVL